MTAEAVIFDWGGTITPWHQVDLRSQWEAFARGYGTMACAFNDLASRLLAAEDAIWARSRAEQVPARLDDVLIAAGLDPAAEATLAGVAAYREFHVPHSITHPAIGYLWEDLRAKGLKIGILSNTVWDPQWHREWLERDGVWHLVDADLWTSAMAVTKPHPEAFRAAAEALGCEPSRCVYVGDRYYEDIYGAHRAGMSAILIPHSQIPLDQQVAVDDQPDAIAHELGDISALVEDLGATRAPGA